MINRLKKQAKQYWIVFYYDDDKKTFNPGVQVSDWDTVQEIERITCSLKREGRKVHISTTMTVFNVDR